MPAPKSFKVHYPTYIYAVELAEVVGWRTERIRRLWYRHGISMKVGGVVATTPEKIQMLWPEQWDTILALLEEGKYPWSDHSEGKQ